MTNGNNGGGAGAGANDPNGMERLSGETDQQYIARQTRLRDEARARMAAKFGGSGRKMGGVGSDSSYDPNRSYGGSGLGGDVDKVLSGVGSAFSTMGLLAGAAASTAAGAAQNVASNASTFIKDGNTQKSISGITSTVKTTGASFWGELTSSVGTVAKAINQPEEDDGLATLQRQIQSQKANNNTGGGVKYSGFGSDQITRTTSNVMNIPSSTMSPGSNVGEAPGLPGEDRNGMARLTGESDEQYIARQTRIRDEAKARMAAKFGSGGLGSASGMKAGGGGGGGGGGLNSGFGLNPGFPKSSSGVMNMNSAFGGMMNSGFGMNPAGGGGGRTMMNSGAAQNTAGSSTLAEATGLPGEDRNGVERLTGETDDQYVLRQTRLRDEAKARMAAKFGGGGGLGSAGPTAQPAPQPAPNSGGLATTVPRVNPARSGGSAPSSGNSAAAAKALASDNFFESFGS